MICSPTPPAPAKRACSARHLKLLGAVLILLGLVLPLYSCRGSFVDASGREVRFVDQKGAPVEDVDLRQPLPQGVTRLEPDMKPPEGFRYRKHRHYFFTDFAADDVVDWFRLGGFLWPMAAALFAGRLRRKWSRWLFRGLEPLLVAETAFSLSIGAMFGTKEIGFWSAWAGVILYSLGAAWSDTEALRLWKPDWGRVPRIASTVLIFAAFLAGSVLSVMSFFKWFVS